MFENLKPERSNWQHYFGGLCFLILILQLATGIFLALFYDPTLNNAYKSVQYLTNRITGGSLMRNLHRCVAFSLFIAVLIHTIRSTLRKEFMNPRVRVSWLTGVLLLLPIFLSIVTGLILPWEWKGYWFMEMIPNYSEFIPFIGPALKPFFIDTFTLPRYLVIHILILPIISLILIDYHLLAKLRRRGIFRYLLRHTLVALPLLILLVILAVYITIPSEDPEVIPMPLEGQYTPAPEWYPLIILLPLMYLKGNWIPILSIYLPLLIFIALAFLPYFIKGKEIEEEVEVHPHPRAKGLRLMWHKLRRGGMKRKVARGVVVFIIFAILASLIYLGAYNSPTLGCNSCHNLDRGFRMGVPPETFKDRKTLPNLDDNQWMMGHWFYPTEVY
ncbi:MAG: cytochrome b N-terminal domain-containing protein [Deltaproteobacteria bacterium]|nr:cytochrome b N-terminal domain-containing protein [Deltaproteobacteria bacterium]